jgi:hypothetical protein
LTACPGLLNGYHEEGDAFWGALSLEMIPGSTITLQKANATLWNRKIKYCQLKGDSKPNHQWEKWCWHSLRIHKGQFWNTVKRVAQQLSHAAFSWLAIIASMSASCLPFLF